MKKLFLLSIILGAQNITDLRAQTFEWARQAGYHSSEMAHSVATDGAGYCYLTGEMSPQTSFGSTTFGGSFIEGFVAKYDPAGDLVWVSNITGPDTESPYQVSADAEGNSYVTGLYNQTATFGNISVTATGSYDAFLARYNSNGDPVWVRGLESTSAAYGSGVFAAADGNVFICGAFFQSISFGNQTLTSAGMDDIFIAKYDSSGNLIWAARAGGPGADYANDIAFADGKIYVTGAFQQTATFGTSSLTSAGHYDIFLSCYDSTGNAIWSRRAGSDEFLGEAAASLSVSGNGKVFICGSAGGTADFGTHSFTSNGGGSYVDAYVAAYDTSGLCLWVRNGGGIIADAGMSVAVVPGGNIYTTGSYNAVADFGPFQLQPISQSSDIFLTCYDENGNIQWVKRAGGGYGPDAGEGLCYDGNGGLYLGGFFYREASFDSITLPWIYQERNIFVAHIDLDNAVGTNEMIVDNDSGKLLFPNPVNGTFYLRSHDDMSQYNSVLLLDLSGRVLEELAPIASEYGVESFDVSHLKPGTYFIKTSTNNETRVSKLIKL